MVCGQVRMWWLSLSLLLLTSSSAVVIQTGNHWLGGFQMSIKIPIDKELDGWLVHLKFSEEVDEIQQWAGKATALSKTEFTITNLAFNSVEHPGDVLTFDLVGHGTGDIKPSVEATILPAGANVAAGGTGTPKTGGGTSNKNYADALAKSILFYAAQRSGKLPANNPIKWRGDSALGDCVVGGWYDAGDHVKFGLPFASTTHLLLWSLVQFKDGYEKAKLVDQMFDSIKWATDYMLGAWNPTTKELVVQIGDGNLDHHFWGRPEDMTMARPCLKITGVGKGGADVAGETAAALALGYLAFKEKGDTAYAAKLLSAAESLYAFGKANPGIYTKAIPAAGNFYSSGHWEDEMCLGAMWLFRATKKAEYLADAKGYHSDAWAWALSWDDKSVLCQLLLFEETKIAGYKQEVVGYFSGWLPGGTTVYTPCGLAWRDTWGSTRYAGNSAFAALLTAEAGIEALRLRQFAIQQINYILGDNKHDGGCFSFEIGYGKKYPRSPHHRAASCPDRPAPCTDAQLHSPGPSPQLLVGGLVGGPDTQDHYNDSREDYTMNEVAIDYNSGFQSALAGILHLQITGNFPPTENKCPCKDA